MKTLWLTLFSLFHVATSLAQSPPGPFLQTADVDRFINSGVEIMAELEALGGEMYEADEDDEEESYEDIITAYNEAIQSNEALQIIKKYGWAPGQFGEKIMSIVMGTTYLIAEKQLIEMPAEHRAMMEEMINEQFKTIVHPDDLKILEPRLSELETIFNQLE